MGALLSLVQIKFGPADDHFFAVFQIMVEQSLQVKDAGLSPHQRQHDDAEGSAKGGLSQEVIEHHLRVHIFRDFNDDAHTFPV